MNQEIPKLDVETLKYVYQMLKVKHQAYADGEYEIRCGGGDASRLQEASWGETVLRGAYLDVRRLIEAQQEVEA